MKPLTLRKATKLVWQSRRKFVAGALIPIYFFTTVPQSAWATSSDTAFAGPVLTPKNVHVNKSKPEISHYSGIKIPSSPSNLDITYSHAFREPLVPVGGTTNSEENKSLGVAIQAFLNRTDDEDVSTLTGFTDRYANSAWRPSLDLNVAEILFRTGNFSQALEAWDDAWKRTQTLKDAVGQKIANLALGKLAEMKARIGRTDELVSLYQQIKGRDVAGVAAQLLVQARSGLWLMQNRPQDAFRCGPSALQELSLATKHQIDHPELIKQSRSTPQGVALSDVQTLAGKIDMPMQMAKRTNGAEFVVPAVIHWKLGHYAALVGEKDGKYIVHDTTFGGGQFLISSKALEHETSGYFLVPMGTLPKGWTSVGKEEGSKVFGRGNPGISDPTAYSPNDGNSTGGDCGTGGTGNMAVDPNGTGTPPPGKVNPDSTVLSANNEGDQDETPSSTLTAMTESTVKAMLVSLNLFDTPVRYAPPVGPTMHFTVQYNQREIAQPVTFTYANLGPNWTFSYMSYVTPTFSYANVYERGGGEEMYYYNFSTNSYYPAQRSQAVLAQVNSTTWQRTLPGGEIETFGQPDGEGNYFLTKITDAQGNSLTLRYDSHFRLAYLTDAIGQVTTIAYASNTLGNALFYNISTVTDPFGRSAQFNYDGSGRLQKITDILGITSQFTYLSNNFINSLTTPYGVTSFAFGDNSTDPSLGSTKWLETTYPDGNKTRTEFNQNVGGLANADPKGIPSGMYPGITATNDYMQFRNTYYWDKQAMHDYPRDYSHAEVTHWLHTSDINTCSDVEESLKKVAQNRIWYAYGDGNPGQTSSIQASDTMIDQPTQKGRIMDDGSTQLYQYQYNATGRVTQEIDPLGRETDYVYDSNNLDLISVKQKNGSGFDVLSISRYNSQHEPLAITNASGQTTVYSYYPNGQLHTITNAKGQTTTSTYNSSGYLVSVTGPLTGSTTTFTYDGYGRVRTITDPQGYTTTTDYDVMDRPTQVTYHDGTTSQMTYQNLDLLYSRDRLSRVTRYVTSPIRQVTAVIDPQGHVTTSNWTLSAGLGSIIDPSGHVTAWKYDSQNRPIEKDYPDGSKIQTSYELTTSRVKTVTDNKGQIATMTYNGDNTQAQVTYTNATIATPSVSYTYDPVYPRTATMTDGTGTTTYTYNAVTGGIGSNMLGSVQTPLVTTTYTYDELGRQLSETVGGVTSSVTYDALGRMTTATNALSGTAFTYAYLNNTSRISSVTNPNGQKTIYTYQDSTSTNEPRLTEINNVTASAAVISKFDYAYDAQGQITSWTQQTDSNHPQNWAIQHDADGKLTGASVTDTTTSAVLHQYAYLYDAAGNRTGEQIDGNVTSSAYNNLNQLTGQTSGGKMVFSGSLTEPSIVTVGGNPATTSYSTSFLGVANVTNGTNSVSVIANDVNGNYSTNRYQVVVAPTSGSFTYDLNGNLMTDGARTYGWDAKNELVSIIYNTGTNAGNHTEFTYNGSGARVKIVERSGTTIGSGTITSTKQYAGNEELDATGTVTKRYFSQGEQRIISGVTTDYFYTRDHLGSIREMIDGSGTIQARYSYDPFGRSTQVSGSLSCDFQYAGMYEHTPSGLNLTPARAYNPNLGRFISRDPSGEGSGLNLYAYCQGNPIDSTDTSGLCMDSPPQAQASAPAPNPQAPSEDELKALAIQHFIDEGFPAWAAEALVDAGTFEIHHDTSLKAINNVLMVVQVADGAGEVEAAAEESPVALSKIEQIVKDIEDSGATVKQNPLKPNQEGNITIDMGEEGRINVRVETHPLEPGGAPVRHANVEPVVESGGQKIVTNKHITN